MKVDSGMMLAIAAVAIFTPPKLLRAQPGGAAHGYALVIGITGYPKFQEADRLRFADADARSFAQFLQSPAAGEFPEGQVRLLLDQSATRSGIYEQISWISRRASSNDVVYIFFAGHGVLDDSQEAYFMPYDADPSDPYALGIRADSFLQELRHRITAKQVVFFIDACHAAAVYSPGGLATRGGGNIVPALRAVWQEELAHLQELNMGFLAAASNQLSLEDADLHHGVFTWFLIKGLQGAADTNHDHRVTAGELRDYLVDKVEAYSRSRAALQTPTTSPAFDADRVLAIVPASAPMAAMSKIGPPPPPMSKIGPPPETAPASFKLLAVARDAAPRGNQRRFDFDISIASSPATLSRVVNVAYDLETPGNPLHFDSASRSNGFQVSYNGWGCYPAVHVRIEMMNPSETVARDFNMCESLGWR
jgi:hypothetical protein